MTGSVTPVGPVPPGADPEAYDRLRRRVLWAMPSGLYLLGSAAGGRRNLMTLNWATQVASEPKLVAVSVERSAVTHQLISDGEAFSLSILRRADRAVVRKFVKPAVDDGETLAGYPVHQAATGAPILADALAWLDCRLWTFVEADSHTLFVGEIVDCGATDGSGEVLRMEDTRMNYGG